MCKLTKTSKKEINIKIKVTGYDESDRKGYQAFGEHNGKEIEFDPFTSTSWNWEDRKKYLGKEYLFNGKFVENNTVFLVYEVGKV